MNKIIADRDIDDLQTDNIKRLKDLFTLKRGEIETDELDNELKLINTTARIVNNFQMMKRIQLGQNIRIINLISNDTSERKQYIEIAMPQSVPKIEKKA